ncbi:MAG: CoA transferase [Solirubrobacterales bacterium]|nr:CoA transferase [Solirubrobacterales bacterium]HMT05644.1 CoA transferase [Solirubrobacterales bacterium]
MTALEGLLIADFSRVLAGPLVSMTLADFGADVIKVEPPGGDETRDWSPPVDNEGRATFFLAVNRNKRSVELNLKDPEDLTLARELVRRADVLIENFRPGTMDRLGLGYDEMSDSNPGLVYCSISGFGSKGGAGLPGYDPLVQAMSGMMSVTGPVEGDPSKVGVALVDVIAGLNATVGVLVALEERRKSGLGQKVESNLLGSALAALENQAAAWLNTGVLPVRLGNIHPSIEPFTTFTAADGPVMICVGNEHQFRSLCEVLGEPELADDPRYADNPDRVENRVELEAELNLLFAARPVGEWVDALHEAGVPAGPVNTIEGGFAVAEELGLDPIDEIDGVRTPASPILLDRTPAETRLPPPAEDAHGEEIRDWLKSG